MINIRLNMFETWLREPALGRSLVYHRGELARDAKRDPGIAALAARVREESTGYFAEISPCGHERHHTTGRGIVEATSRRERGEFVHVVRRVKI
jgi:hypothetical protein